MTLLVITQTVDTEDPILGFFHEWIKELATIADTVEVICLKEGKHSLPKNVRVHSLGKEQGRRSSAIYALRFLKILWDIRGSYQTVFIHMNQEYLLLAGWWWRIARIPTYLWRNHVQGDWRTSIACMLANTVFFTSPHSFVARYQRSVRMPIGIDTDLFRGDGERISDSLLFLGRIDAIKRLDLALEAVSILIERGIAVRFFVYGAPSRGQEHYAENLRRSYAHLEEQGVVHYEGSVSHAQAPRVYAQHSVYLNLTPSGGFDKTIGEAMASGCLVVCANEAVHEALPEAFAITHDSPAAVADALAAALQMQEREQASARATAREHIINNHSLKLLSRELARYLRP